MKVKTSELTGAALDWAVSKASNPPGKDGWGWFERDDAGYLFDPLNECRYSPSTDWAQGGPIIELEGISVMRVYKDLPLPWCAERGEENFTNAITPLLAAMRCYVASKLGDDIDVPEELK